MTDPLELGCPRCMCSLCLAKAEKKKRTTAAAETERKKRATAADLAVGSPDPNEPKEFRNIFVILNDTTGNGHGPDTMSMMMAGLESVTREHGFEIYAWGPTQNKKTNLRTENNKLVTQVAVLEKFAQDKEGALERVRTTLSKKGFCGDGDVAEMVDRALGEAEIAGRNMFRARLEAARKTLSTCWSRIHTSDSLEAGHLEDAVDRLVAQRDTQTKRIAELIAQRDAQTRHIAELIEEKEDVFDVVCHHCRSKPAVCVGAYDNQTEELPACGDCCGHGCEDGNCVPLLMSSLLESRQDTVKTWAENDELQEVLTGPERKPLTDEQRGRLADLQEKRRREKLEDPAKYNERSEHMLKWIMSVCPACGGEENDHAPGCVVAELKAKIARIEAEVGAVFDVTWAVGARRRALEEALSECVRIEGSADMFSDLWRGARYCGDSIKNMLFSTILGTPDVSPKESPTAEPTPKMRRLAMVWALTTDYTDLPYRAAQDAYAQSMADTTAMILKWINRAAPGDDAWIGLENDAWMPKAPDEN